MINRRQVSVGILGACFASKAFGYPTRQLSIVVPFAPGASADGISRIVSSYLGPKVGATTIVENRPGGGGVAGLQFVSRSKPDGQTIAVGATGAVVINPNIPGALAFHPLSELAPVAKLVDIPIVFVANPKSGMMNLREVVSKSKLLPEGLNFGTTGTNSTQHLAIELLKRRTGANLVHIPYRGSAPAVTDVISGQIPLACVDLTSAIAHIRAGTLRAIGVTSANRYSLTPDIPTFAEQDVSGFELTAWLGMFAPPKVPSEVINELSNSLRDCMADAHTIEAAKALACSPSYLDSASFTQFITGQLAKVKQLLTTT